MVNKKPLPKWKNDHTKKPPFMEEKYSYQITSSQAYKKLLNIGEKMPQDGLLLDLLCCSAVACHNSTWQSQGRYPSLIFPFATIEMPTTRISHHQSIRLSPGPLRPAFNLGIVYSILCPWSRQPAPSSFCFGSSNRQQLLLT